MNTTQTLLLGGAVAVLVVGGLLVVPGSLGQTDSPTEIREPETPTGDTATPTDTDGTALSPVDDSLVLETRPNETIAGVSDLDAGTELIIRVRSTDAANPFLHQQDATVSENGTFDATVDLSNVGSNATATVTVQHDGEQLADRDTQVVFVPTASSTPDAETGTQLALDGDRLTVQRAPDQRLGGTTPLEPGTELVVRAQSTNDSTPFLRQESTTVADDGTFAVSMDFDTLDSGTTFEVTVLSDGEELTVTDARVA